MLWVGILGGSLARAHAIVAKGNHVGIRSCIVIVAVHGPRGISGNLRCERSR